MLFKFACPAPQPTSPTAITSNVNSLIAVLGCPESAPRLLSSLKDQTRNAVSNRRCAMHRMVLSSRADLLTTRLSYDKRQQH